MKTKSNIQKKFLYQIHKKNSEDPQIKNVKTFGEPKKIQYNSGSWEVVISSSSPFLILHSTVLMTTLPFY